MLVNWARAAGFAAVLVVALGGSLYWAFGDWLLDSPQCKNSTRNHQTITQEKQPRTAVNIPLDNLITTKGNDAEAEQSNNYYYECLLAEYTRELAAFTKGLAIGTILLVIVTFMLVGFAYRSFIDTRILERAYLSAEPQGVSAFRPPTSRTAPLQTYVGHVGFRNAGRLPALNVKWYLQSDYLTDPDYNPVHTGILSGSNVVSPGSIMTQGSPEKPIPGHWGYFYIWGKVVYDDGFGNSQETVFCHRYNCRRMEPEKGGGFFRIRPRYGRQHDKGQRAT